jgi:hypothetical protein
MIGAKHMASIGPVGRAAVLLLAGALGLEPLSGQIVQAGDSVRLRMPSALSVEGLAESVRGEMLLVRTEGVEDIWQVSMFDMAQLDVRRRRTSQEAFRRGFGYGLVAGLFVGAAIGLVVHATGLVGGPDDPPAERLLQTTFRGIGLGMISGGFVGGLVAARRPGFGWVEIRLPAS